MICAGVYPFLAIPPFLRDYNWYRLREQVKGVEMKVVDKRESWDLALSIGSQMIVHEKYSHLFYDTRLGSTFIQ